VPRYGARNPTNPMSGSDFLFVTAVGVATACLTWMTVAILIRFASKIGLIDRPNERSLHSSPTPRGGGVGFVFAIVVFLVAVAIFGSRRFESTESGSLLPIGTYLGTALLIAAISLCDDFKSLGAGLRLLVHFAAAATALAGIGYFRYFSIPGLRTADFGWIGPALTFIWIVGLTNVYNFMDGIDGIAGMQGLIAGIAWAIAGTWQGSPVVAMLGLMLAGGCLGFIVHNWAPAKIFMGDVGSAFLGYSFSILPLLSLNEAERAGRTSFSAGIPIFALLVVWPFVGDGLFTFARRARRRDAVWRPHKTHLYQRLVRAGWTHARVTSLYAAWCVMSLLAGLLWLSGYPIGGPIAVFFPPLSLLIVYGTVKILERRASECHA
jgi:UDP-N-acetylmuramyl pentapeptide phosphotransferase/UDP-N-acetylglucosamine-1-phosphate transferase